MRPTHSCQVLFLASDRRGWPPRGRGHHLIGKGRRLDTIVTYAGPPTTLLMGRNFEGIALLPIGDCRDGRRAFFMITDCGDLWSLMMYVDFPC